jgi:hypothetical protein
MELNPVSSSNIAAVGYDEEKKELTIQFHSGGTYVYDDVEKEVHQKMLLAGSVGQYFQQNVKPFYSFYKI